MTGVDIALLLLAIMALAGLSRLLPARESSEQSLVEQLGLSAQGEGIFECQRAGRRVRLELRGGTPGTVSLRLGVELRRSLAPGLELDVTERGLGHVLGLTTAVVAWDDEGEGPLLLGVGLDPIRASLSAPRGLDFSPVRPDPVLEEVELRLAISIGLEELEIGFPQIDRARLGNLLDACVELAELLEEAEDGPWREAAEAIGLDLVEGRIEGELQGLVVRGVYEEQTVLEFGPLDLPEGLRVHSAGSLKLGSPVLDLLIGMDTEVDLPPRFDEPELAEALLAALHQFPGSTLEATRLRVVAPGRLRERLRPALEAGLRLARLLAR